MNFSAVSDVDFSIQFCEYNYSNPDYDQIYRPKGSGDYLFLLFKTPMKVYRDQKFHISRENACILYAPGCEQHYKAVQKFRNRRGAVVREAITGGSSFFVQRAVGFDFEEKKFPRRLLTFLLCPIRPQQRSPDPPAAARRPSAIRFPAFL